MTKVSQIENALLVYQVLSHRYGMSIREVEQKLADQGIIKSSDSIRRWLKAWCFVGYVEEIQEGRHYQYQKVRMLNLLKVQRIIPIFIKIMR